MNTIKKHISKTLYQNRKQLIDDFLETGKTFDFQERHTRILDNYFQESYERSQVGSDIVSSGNPYTIIALGGYGRGEQCVHSDIDVMFLFKKRVPNEAAQLIQEIIYPLWDMGFDVGHATRSIDECMTISKNDIVVFTSLLDARPICGMTNLYLDFMDRFKNKIIAPKTDKYIQWLIETNRERHQHFGDSSYLLEPNLKEGQGGLRDYHTIFWACRIGHSVRQARDLIYEGCLSHDEFKILTEALDFIWEVRNRLHILAGRKCDRLFFEYQETLAETLNFKLHDGQQPVEQFLGLLHGYMDFLKQLHLIFVYECEKTAGKLGRKKKNSFRCKYSGIEAKWGVLNFVSPEAIKATPDLLIKIFEESARLGIPLSLEARRLVREFLDIVDRNYRTSKFAIHSFEEILVTPAPTYNVLNEMLITGFLVQFIPEFNGILNRIQYDEYHVYPVDRHSLRTVRTLKNFGSPEDRSRETFCEKLYADVDRKIPLLWAALLHDIGKMVPGGNHSEKGSNIAKAILTEKGYSDEDVETVRFLVLEHLLLINAATRRDINDEETALFCARKIKDIAHLKMLYLLTAADSIATGPKAWNEWTASLLKTLYMKVAHTIEQGGLATQENSIIVENKKTELIRAAKSDADREEYTSLLRFMSDRYLIHSSVDEIVAHIDLFRKIEDKHAVWTIGKTPDLNTRSVTVCAKDAPGLFSKISGVLTLNGIDILDARIHTWKNGIAMDIFKVKPPPDPIYENDRWNRAYQNLVDTLAGQLDLKEALKEKFKLYGQQPSKHRRFERRNQVIVDNHASSFFTIIEVYSYDTPGLLHKITDAMYRCNLDIRFSIIATKVDQIVDVFYVKDFDGNKLDSAEEPTVIETIEKALPQPFTGN